jgi:hypothetical protein
MTRCPICGQRGVTVKEKLVCDWCRIPIETCCEGGPPDVQRCQKTTIYVAGPMTGVPYFGYPAFDTARDYLASHGITVLSPPDRDRSTGFDPATLGDEWNWNTIPKAFDITEARVWCAGAVGRSDATLMLSGWFKSRGARWEKDLAEMLDKPVFFRPEDAVTFARGR